MILSQFHRRPGGTGLARFEDLARAWSASGVDVSIVTSDLEHATGEKLEVARGKLVTRERVEGADVSRVWTPPLDKSRALLRILRDVAYAAGASVVSLVARRRPDAVIASSPPLFTALGGLLVARIRGARFVFEVRDLWPDFAIEFGALRGAPASLALRLERFLYRRADLIVVVTPGFKERIAAKGIEPEKIVVMPNGVDRTTFVARTPRERTRQELGWEGRFVAIYAGVHGPAQALSQVVGAAQQLASEASVLFVLVGDGEEKPALMAAAQRAGLANVRFMDPVARERIPDLLAAADVGLVVLKDLPAFRHVYPAKLFESMGAGLPTIFAGSGDAADLVARAQGGVAVPPERPEELAAAVRAFAKAPAEARAAGERAARFVAKEHDRARIAAAYLQALAG